LHLIPLLFGVRPRFPLEKEKARMRLDPCNDKPTPGERVASLRDALDEIIARLGLKVEPMALRPHTAAAVLGISVTTLEEWTKRGLIPHKKIVSGSRSVVLYPVEELKAWVAGRDVP
jgi:excisionase family DNA binding protein